MTMAELSLFLSVVTGFLFFVLLWPIAIAMGAPKTRSFSIGLLYTLMCSSIILLIMALYPVAVAVWA